MWVCKLPKPINPKNILQPLGFYYCACIIITRGLRGYDGRSLTISSFHLTFNYLHCICLCWIVAASKVWKIDSFLICHFKRCCKRSPSSSWQRGRGAWEGCSEERGCCGAALPRATLQAAHAANIRAWEIAGTWRSRKLSADREVQRGVCLGSLDLSILLCGGAGAARAWKCRWMQTLRGRMGSTSCGWLEPVALQPRAISNTALRFQHCCLGLSSAR